MTAGDANPAQSYARARDGTLYWTLSLYIDPARVAAAAGAVKPLDHRTFHALQHDHPMTRVLRDAIDPLFNDIAEREILGEVQEMLIAAGETPDTDIKLAGKALRTPEELTFHPPGSVAWSTEGVTYRATPPGLSDPRPVQFRRFWFAHNNGALSYHMSFSHHYAGPGGSGYGPATYYFLSMLQKLAAPKEFALSDEKRRQGGRASVRAGDLGIAPLTDLSITDADERQMTFWSLVEDRLLSDARSLFRRLGRSVAASPLEWGDLIEEVPFIEVPGLVMPKARFMFVIHDERFFKRLMPLDPSNGDMAPRKLMVQDPCYLPYQDALAARLAAAEQQDGTVELDSEYWRWATTQPHYLDWISRPEPVLRRSDGSRLDTLTELAAAMQRGEVERAIAEDGTALVPAQPVSRVPAFEPSRADCLDYLFLAGFNQNIIDFMNQDPSEILDSIDPIYPEKDDQAGERFFVRYANHRAMLTYVPRSRSLEAGNDYIGTCPYAFLIHVMSLHNEFLAREHEARSMARVDHIDWLVTGGARDQLSQKAGEIDAELRAAQTFRDGYDLAELAINQAKLAEYRDYERFRYINPFRYDTERDVFAKLEELRGVKRKKDALSLALSSLEDHASDLQRRHEQRVDRAAARRGTWLNILLGGTGIFGAGQMMYWIGETAAGDPAANPPKPAEPVRLAFLGLSDVTLTGQTIMSVTQAVMFYALIFFVPFLIFVLTVTVWGWICTRRSWVIPWPLVRRTSLPSQEHRLAESEPEGMT